MAKYQYQAVDHSGNRVGGAIEAVNRSTAVAELAKRGQFVVKLVEGTGAAAAVSIERLQPRAGAVLRWGRGRVRSKDVFAVTGQLATALRAGLPLLKALEIIRDQQTRPATRRLLSELADSVSSGESFSEALAGQQRIFSPLYVSMVRVGETGGILDETMAQLAQLLGRDEKVKTSMKNAAAYPVFVLCVGLVSVGIVLTVILPRILETLTGGIAALPWPTQMLLALSGFMRNYGWAVGVAAAAGGFIGYNRVNTPQGRAGWDSFKLKIPVLGRVLRTIAVGRFTRTLGALTRGGVTILQALSVVRDTLGNEILAREVDIAAGKVKGGEPLGESLGASGRFPPLLVQIVSIGEQTGKLDEMLLGAAETFEGEADAAISRFMAIFPAVLILLLAVVIGFIIAATLLPIVVMELGAGVL